MSSAEMLADGLYLGSFLAPLGPWLEQADLTDIYVNKPGEIWTEALGGLIERHDLPELDQRALLRLARQVAAANSQGINRESPLLAGSLPDGSRIQIALPPATRGDVALAIRRHVVQDIDLGSYRRSAEATENCQEPTRRTKRTNPELDMIDDLREAVRLRRNILISGGTSSGKTTFLNALLGEIPAGERLITIEDAPELRVKNANSVGLLAARGALGEADVTAEDLLIAALRLRPDRIILGEIRGREALTFLRAVNTGHPGSITTIHADSPDRAIDQLALLVQQSGGGLSWDDTVHYIRRSIDIIVQLSRAGGARGIDTIMHVLQA
ncbi:MAG: P-type DNA transfer ATPase VirB11 [Novosphingobium sp.]|uniref:P-type DNA transfer ATPase VirB11 n=1 Tax=Novosphingobium sp. TaxID=1874826 RepID=UPI0032BC48C9